jgi:16S rRNA (cytosine1402-N4)-methyltransferase
MPGFGCGIIGNMNKPHIPVMLRQSLELLNVSPGKVYVDATAGAGGHLREIAARTGSSGTVVGIDQDLNSLNKLEATLQPEGIKNVKLAHANFRDIKQVIGELDIGTINGGILADLGVSSMQLDNAERGFSFIKDGPLDMRMNPTARVTAEKLVNELPERELADIIYRYGEERLSRQIAHRIKEARPIKTTSELAAVVSRVVGPRRKRGADRDESHPATRTFQALRIAVNDELGAIEEFLREAIEVLEPGARLVVITFHSLEDRLVKQILREAAASCICPPRQPVCTCNKRTTLKILTPKPLLPDPEETLANPRSRSAKLRAGEKVS